MSLRLKALCPSNVHIDKIILDTMEFHWYTWAKDSLTYHDKTLWSADMHLMLWPHSKMSALSHFLGSYGVGDVSWVNVTMGKVMFGAEFLKTQTAASAQAKWPNTDLALWKQNCNGPTKHMAFLANPFFKQTLVQLEGLKLREGRPWLQDAGLTPKPNMPSRQVAFASSSDSDPNSAPAAVTANISSESATIELINKMKKDIGDIRGLIDTQRQEYALVKAANEEEISWLQWRIQDALDGAQKEMKLMREAHKQEITEL